jgi:mono/diheme cytochrome c family protein
MAATAALGLTFGASLLIHGQTHAIMSTPPTAPREGGALPAQIVHGHLLFSQECVTCHGNRAQGGIGPDLRRLEISDAQIAQTIKAGMKPEMPAYGQKYSESDVRALTQYLRSLHKS